MTDEERNSGSGLIFEVTDTDLSGRIGRIKVNGRRMATPCILPVVHPTRQVIPLSELMSLGFEGVMTNSLIARRLFQKEAEVKGIHSLLGFEGVVMTDSGGYQALEYGRVDVEPLQIAEFQSAIGSDLAVTLDRPTGLSWSRKYARATVEYTLKNAIETLAEQKGGRTVWVGPIQGGLFQDLTRGCTKKLIETGFEYLALGSPTEVMESYMFAELVKMIAAAKRSMPYGMPLHLFGAGHPLTMALSVALGCDTFDSASYILFARQERYMTEKGVSELRRMEYLPCSCPVCSKSSLSELLSIPREERVRRLALHNLHLLRKEMLECREAIVEGRLWDLVEERASAHPRLMAAFLEMARLKELMSLGTPFIKERGLMLRAEIDSQRPELRAVGLRLKNLKRQSRREALLLLRQGHTRENQGRHKRQNPDARGAYDKYRVHPQLGVYPAELDFLYPFTQTVSLEERPLEPMVARAVKELRKMGYKRVLKTGGEPPGASRRPRTVKSRRKSSPSPSAL